MPFKRWIEFFLYLGRVFVLLILLAILLPKLIVMCNFWMAAIFHHDQKPNGNPMRVEKPSGEIQIVDLVKPEQGKYPLGVEVYFYLRKEG